MRYLFLGLLLVLLSACGGENNSSSENTEKPSVPQTKDASKQPPFIPLL